MRSSLKWFVTGFACLVLAAPAIFFTPASAAQGPGQAPGPAAAQVFSAADVHGLLAQLADQAKAKGSTSSTLADYGSHALRLNARTTSGGGEIHAHYDDVMLVTEGKATLITGGTVIDPHTGSDGETRGSGIQNGIVQTISVGDIVHIPAGTPHQLVVASGTTYSYVVIKVRE
jgi:mannose-6-phosphate isomerase-like protein (cupin superfamily)